MGVISESFPYHPRDVARHLPVVGVGALVYSRDKDAFLLGRRIGAHGADTWSVPGGHLDHGEGSTECAARETREETGLDLAFRQWPAGISECVVEGLHYVTIFVPSFLPWGCKDEPRVTEPDKFVDLTWVRWEDFPQRNLFRPLATFWAKHSRGFNWLEL